MNKFTSLILLAVLAFSLTACAKRDEVPEPSSSTSSSSEVSSSIPEKKPESSSSNEATQTEDIKLTETYYDYFAKNPFISTLFMDKGIEAGFADSAADLSIGAYAISYLVYNDPDYNFEKGSKLSDFDAVTRKYFGRKLTSYENDFITLMPDDHISSTGWGFNASDLVLKDIKHNENGTKTATFYMISTPMEGPEAAQRKVALLKGDFYGYNGIQEIMLTFEEMLDDKNNMYLKYIFAEPHSEVQKPYKVYGL